MACATALMLMLSLLLSINSCRHDVKPDISGVNYELQLRRFEKELFAINAGQYKEQIDSLQQEYPVLFPFYFHEIGGWDMTADTSSRLKDSILQYVRSPYGQALYDSTMRLFDDLAGFEEELETSLKYFRYYFPDLPAPKVTTLINAPPAFTVGNDLICISLDKYMGPSSAFYQYEAEAIPYYLLRRFKAPYMVSNCMQVLATANFEIDMAGKKLLEAMIYSGKIFYLKQQVMPGSPDSIITGFEQKDLEWCRGNEPEIWKFFIEYKLLYNTEPLEYSKYVTEGPSTSGMPPEAPGNIGSWTGWRIVSSYMKRNPDITLQQLMLEDDAQKILTESKYKPLR